MLFSFFIGYNRHQPKKLPITIRWGEGKRMVMARQENSTVMLSAAKHLDAQRERPFAAAQGDTVS